jgi:hypothetical protein
VLPTSFLRILKTQPHFITGITCKRIALLFFLQTNIFRGYPRVGCTVLIYHRHRPRGLILKEYFLSFCQVRLLGSCRRCYQAHVTPVYIQCMARYTHFIIHKDTVMKPWSSHCATISTYVYRSPTTMVAQLYMAAPRWRS